jgi:hypothetical protein
MQDVSTCTGINMVTVLKQGSRLLRETQMLRRWWWQIAKMKRSMRIAVQHRVPPRTVQFSCQRNSYSGCRVIQELAKGIASAKQLKVLDLSQNGLSEEAMQWLYPAWASGERGDGMAWKHVSKDVVHFSVDGMSCCRLKPCCRRDLQM